MTKSVAPETVLVLQGGGALGAYQAGVYEGLAEAGEGPGWIAGISIGAINAALIVGNPPEHRVARLRDFWHRITAGVTVDPWLPGDQVRALFNTASAYWTAAVGVRGFFTPRIPPPSFYPAGSPEALSVYDTSPLRKTLEEFVDFELINSGRTRLSVGAVNVRSGNFAYFDSRAMRLGPEHIMASGALPPGFPPVEIDGEHYWDGGLVSNTPLQYVLDHEHERDLRIYQVDLFSAKGALPRNLSEAAEREKDIRFSSRTRMNTDEGLRLRRARAAFRSLLTKLPQDLASDPDVTLLTELAQESAVTVVHLIYQDKPYEGGSKDFEFSRRTMLEHWAAGLADVRRTMVHGGEIKQRPAGGGAKTFDIHRKA
ncbi:MAG: patatin-like phospholipase family protein [Alphaproteobacteria bacterium]|nr:patatin-like phospholipase family protein [Alphaproteobacteria bacterium]